MFINLLKKFTRYGIYFSTRGCFFIYISNEIIESNGNKSNFEINNTRNYNLFLFQKYSVFTYRMFIDFICKLQSSSKDKSDE